MPVPLTDIEATLNLAELGETPRALLLLELCHVTRALQPDAFSGFLGQLQDHASALPAQEQQRYQALLTLEVPTTGEAGTGFATRLAAELNEALDRLDSDREAAVMGVEACEAKLRGRWWWPFGLAPAWQALAKAWARIDRDRAIGLLPKLPSELRATFLQQLHAEKALAASEWSLAHELLAEDRILAVVRELLDDGAETLELPEPLVRDVASELIDEAVAHGDDHKERQKTLILFQRLAERVAANDAALTEELARKLFDRIAGAYTLVGSGGHFTKVFAAVRQVIILWSELPVVHKSSASYIASSCPRHLRAFALAQWHAMSPKAAEEAQAAHKALLAAAGAEAEAWFLVVLVLRGLGTTALELADLSDHCDDLVPRIRRAWVANDAVSARDVLDEADFADDPIGRFLLVPTQDERVDYLRSATSRGSRSLPSSFWTRPEIMHLINDQEHLALMATFKKDTSPGEQFSVYLRLHGYGQWSYESLDPLLVGTLVRWAERHPQEVDSLMGHMWQDMKPPSDDYLMLDLVRNVVFERCRTLFAARPQRLFELYLGWVDRKLVKSSVRIENHFEGTVRTLSLGDEAPFLYSLLGAEAVGGASPSCCDEIIITAMKRYSCEDQMLNAAAQLYASDKGLDALSQIPDGLSGEQREALQLAIIRKATRSLLLSMLVAGLQQDEELAAAS
jgi:hypothetical protein